MKIKLSSYFLIMILLAMAAMIGNSLTFRYRTSAYLPVLIGTVVFVLGTIELWKELKEAKNPQREDQPESKKLIVGSTLAWLFSFPVGIYLFGFIIATAIFIFSYLKWKGRSWSAALATAGLTTGCVYGIFETALHAELWKGALF